jgi:hypothetical protein
LRARLPETAKMSRLDGCRQQYSYETHDGKTVQPARLSGSDVHRSLCHLDAELRALSGSLDEESGRF